VNIKFEPQPNEPSRQQQQYHPGAMGGLRWVKAAGAVGGSVGGGWLGSVALGTQVNFRSCG